MTFLKQQWRNSVLTWKDNVCIYFRSFSTKINDRFHPTCQTFLVIFLPALLKIKPFYCSWVNMFRLSNHNAPVSALCRGWETKSVSLASWKMLDCLPGLRLEQQLWHPAAQHRVLECINCGDGDVMCHVMCWPVGLAAVFAPSRSVNQLLGEQEWEGEDSGTSWCITGAEGDSVLLPVFQACSWWVQLPGKKERVQSCSQPSKLAQGWGKTCWAVSEQGFDSCHMRNCLPSPRRCHGLWFVSCDIMLPCCFLLWDFWTLLMGSESFLFSLHTRWCLKHKQNSTASEQQWDTLSIWVSWLVSVSRNVPLVLQSSNGFLLLILVWLSEVAECWYVRPWVRTGFKTGIGGQWWAGKGCCS